MSAYGGFNFKVDHSTDHAPQRIQKVGRYTGVDRGIFTREYDWVPLKALSVLWPEAELRREALKAAKLFVSRMEKRGLRLFTPEDELRIRGPLRPINTHAAGSKDGWRGGYSADEDDSRIHAADFVIVGEFIETRMVYVEPTVRPPWAEEMDREMDARTVEHNQALAHLNGQEE